jgi:hypothetical protein
MGIVFLGLDAVQLLIPFPPLVLNLPESKEIRFKEPQPGSERAEARCNGSIMLCIALI